MLGNVALSALSNIPMVLIHVPVAILYWIIAPVFIVKDNDFSIGMSFATKADQEQNCTKDCSYHMSSLGRDWMSSRRNILSENGDKKTRLKLLLDLEARYKYMYDMIHNSMIAREDIDAKAAYNGATK